MPAKFLSARNKRLRRALKCDGRNTARLKREALSGFLPFVVLSETPGEFA